MEAGMNRVHYTITGLTNAQVKTQLKNVLGEMEGVSMVNIDLGQNSVEVGFKDPADEYQIMQGIEHVGCRIEG